MTEKNSDAAGRLLAAAPTEVVELTKYVDGSIVSRTLNENSAGTLTCFAFDAGQRLSEHSAPFDAFVLVLDGAAELTIGGETVRACAGQIVLMPANVPHAVAAPERFKMLLLMLKPIK